jgi:hypothetical protein
LRVALFPSLLVSGRVWAHVSLLLTNLGNVIMLAVLAAAFFGFLQYQRSQGRSVQVGNKKLN